MSIREIHINTRGLDGIVVRNPNRKDLIPFYRNASTDRIELNFPQKLCFDGKLLWVAHLGGLTALDPETIGTEDTKNNIFESVWALCFDGKYLCIGCQKDRKQFIKLLNVESREVEHQIETTPT